MKPSTNEVKKFDGSTARSRRIPLAGSQRWFLHCRAARGSKGFAADFALVSLGSCSDLAERSDAAYHCLLLGWPDGYTSTRWRVDQHCRQSRAPDFRLGHLRFALDIAIS